MNHNVVLETLKKQFIKLEALHSQMGSDLVASAYVHLHERDGELPETILEKHYDSAVRWAKRNCLIWKTHDSYEYLKEIVFAIHWRHSPKVLEMTMERLKEVSAVAKDGSRRRGFTLHEIDQAVTCARKRVIRNKKRKPTVSLVESLLPESQGMSAVDLIVFYDSVEATLGKDSPDMQVFKLLLERTAFGKLTINQIAKQLGCRPSVARRRLQEVLQKLRESDVDQSGKPGDGLLP